MAKDQYYVLLVDYLDENLDGPTRQAIEQALNEDEDLKTEMEILLAERKAYQGLDDYMTQELPKSLSHKAWLSSLYASVIMIGSFSSRTKQLNQTGKRKSDEGDWALPGDS